MWPLLVLIVLAGTIVIVANSADPLASVSVSDQDLTLECNRNIRQAVSDLTGTDVTADYAAYGGRTARFVIDEIPELTGEPAGADPDATAVLDEIESTGIVSGNWIVAHKTKRRMVLTSTAGGLIFATRTGDDWQLRREYREAPCGVRSEGIPLAWGPARTVKSTDTQLEVLVADDCGDQVIEAFSAVTIGEESVIVTISGYYPRNSDELGCTHTSGRKVVVDLGEPIGERDLFNGSDFPPRRISREV